MHYAATAIATRLKCIVPFHFACERRTSVVVVPSLPWMRVSVCVLKCCALPPDANNSIECDVCAVKETKGCLFIRQHHLWITNAPLCRTLRKKKLINLNSYGKRYASTKWRDVLLRGQSEGERGRARRETGILMKKKTQNNPSTVMKIFIIMIMTWQNLCAWKFQPGRRIDSGPRRDAVIGACVCQKQWKLSSFVRCAPLFSSIFISRSLSLCASARAPFISYMTCVLFSWLLFLLFQFEWKVASEKMPCNP